MGLTPKQSQFVAEYLASGNATKAAVSAGYSKRSARSQGQRLLTKAAIRSAVDGHVEKLEISADEILRGIKAIADGKKHPISVRLKALELLGKHRKLFTDRVEHTGTVSLEQLVVAATAPETAK